MDLNLGIAPPSLTEGAKVDDDTFRSLHEINYILGDMSSQAARTTVIFSTFLSYNLIKKKLTLSH